MGFFAVDIAVVLLFFLSSARSQDFPGQPACAIPCLVQFIPQVGCTLADSACQCDPEKQAALLPIITPCLIGACSIDDLTKAQSAAAASCAQLSSVGGAATSTTSRSTTSPPPVATVRTTTSTSSQSPTPGEPTSSGSTTSTGTATSPLPNQSHSSSLPPPTEADGGLTAGAKAGVAVGVVLAVLLFAGAIFVLFRRRRRNAAGGVDQESSTLPPELGGQAVLGHELDPESAKIGDPAELGNEPVATEKVVPAVTPVPFPPQPAELDASTVPTSPPLHELSTAKPEPMPSELDSMSVPPTAFAAAAEFTSSPTSPEYGISSYVQQPPITTSEPSAAELEQLLHEEEELERRKQTLLELKNVQDEQAALRERIKAMRHGQSSA